MAESKTKLARWGALWHMTNRQLREFMACKNIPLPTDGTGTGAGNSVVKRDLIKRIRESLFDGGVEPESKSAGIPRRVGHLSKYKPLTDPDITAHAAKYKWGGDGDIEAFIGTSLPKDDLILNGPFVEKARIDVPNASRLWSTVVGIDTPASLSVWHGANDTLVVQYLGDSPVMAQMWKMAMKSIPAIDRWTDLGSHLTCEPVTVKKAWISTAQNGMNYAFCLMEGLWWVSLESLFKTFPVQERHSLPLISAIDEAVARVLKAASATSLAGRDTQHYAWNFDAGGWLVLSLMPFPYFFPPYDEPEALKSVPVDSFVRAAASGTGAMYLGTLITNVD